MPEDATLDRFARGVGTGSSGESDPDREGADDETEGGSAATYRWAPDGEPCDACGDPVRRRWRDGDALVCADCKAWDGGQ